MADPASWLVIERGWAVLAADGSTIGSVEETLGDPELDIFAGLAIATGLLSKPRYVSAERVREIRDGQITLDVLPSEVGQLGPYEPPRTA